MIKAFSRQDTSATAQDPRLFMPVRTVEPIAINQVTARLSLQDCSGSTAFETSKYLLSAEKRVLDVFVAVVVLVLFFPMFALVALIIRLTSPGPILFRQVRHGLNGAKFTIYKFRSMYVASCMATTVDQATELDPRVTPFGRFMRRTSIDELPQLLNVLEGTMSLIGPRPHAVAHDGFYASQIQFYTRRFAGRPGLSGLAQIRGARGGTPLLADMERRVRHDIEYLSSASLAVDLRVIIGTLREMLFSSSAY